ncbi:MAG: pyruvate formate lyase family protein [Peptococcaceae bacterium]|jgi:formate C-acetyltransferase|nr:hypothetical protein [Peptococcaceae bacterium]MDH7525752.1 pyruvate formate lyase family protein [Peptococcaceae bacterium]
MAKLLELERELNYSEELRKGMRADIGSTERVKRLSLALRSAVPGICLHTARAYTEVFKETEGEPVPMRFARSFYRATQYLPAIIGEGELIVGLPSCGLKKIPVLPINHASWLIDEIDGLSSRTVNPFTVMPEQIAEAKELLPYWLDKTTYALTTKLCPPDLRRKIEGTGWAETAGYFHQGGSHFNPYYEPILEQGLQWHEERINRQLAALDCANPEDVGKEHFYNALLMVIKAIREFAAKYAEKAREMAGRENDSARKQELLEIAETMEWVPYRGARSFREALQSLWFIHMIMHMEGPGPAYTIGRIDQLMYPFYKADMEKGLLTREKAQELMECLLLKISGNLWLCDKVTALRAAGLFPGQTICIGGLNSEGKDASNEISYLVLDAAKAVRTVQPDIVLLCHSRETPYELKIKAAELVALGLGLPKFISTETTKTQLMEAGFTREEARVGWIRGCTEFYGPGGKQYGYPSAGKFNVGIALEAVLYNGRKRMPDQNMSGETVGVETGEPRQFKTFDEFLAAFKKQVAQQVKDCHAAALYAEKIKMQHLPLLVQSLTTESCIERGRWASAGGAQINVGPSIAITGGIATAADSLAAIKKLVYEEKRITMDELIQAIDANFEGYEPIRQLLINDAPKYGNDDEYVDDLAREVWQFFCAEVRKYRLPFGERCIPSCCIATGYISAGTFTWATPDGRKAGLPLSSHIGPNDNRDTSGPLAHIRSVTKLGLDTGFGSIHNMYFTNIDSREKLHRLVELIDIYISLGGHHIQINCQDKEVLLDAQKHPEKYPTLMVRVAGYVANFIELPKEVQDEIINRTSLNI